jgi:hypothetical protein
LTLEGQDPVEVGTACDEPADNAERGHSDECA